MRSTPSADVETESADEDTSVEAHPGADTLSLPGWDDAGFLRWSHVESEDEAPAT